MKKSLSKTLLTLSLLTSSTTCYAGNIMSIPTSADDYIYDDGMPQANQAPSTTSSPGTTGDSSDLSTHSDTNSSIPPAPRNAPNNLPLENIKSKTNNTKDEILKKIRILTQYENYEQRVLLGKVDTKFKNLIQEFPQLEQFKTYNNSILKANFLIYSQRISKNSASISSETVNGVISLNKIMGEIHSTHNKIKKLKRDQKDILNQSEVKIKKLKNDKIDINTVKLESNELYYKIQILKEKILKSCEIKKEVYKSKPSEKNFKVDIAEKLKKYARDLSVVGNVMNYISPEQNASENALLKDLTNSQDKSIKSLGNEIKQVIEEYTKKQHTLIELRGKYSKGKGILSEDKFLKKIEKKIKKAEKKKAEKSKEYKTLIEEEKNKISELTNSWLNSAFELRNQYQKLEGAHKELIDSANQVIIPAIAQQGTPNLTKSDGPRN